MRRILGVATTTTALLVLAACAPASPDQEESAGGPEHNHATHDHEGEGGSGAEDGHADHAELSESLVRAGDLPAGYRSGAGHHHAVPAADAAPSVPAACLPLAQAIGTHSSVLAPHPQARVSFSKSHFGPEISEAVIDYGDAGEARAAAGDLANVADTCRTYEQAPTGPGAHRYSVSQAPLPAAVNDGSLVHLRAQGSDFEGIGWDVWSTPVGSRLLVVALRTAKGGTSQDLAAAVAAAQDGQRRNPA